MDGVRIEITGAEQALSAVSRAAERIEAPIMMWEAIGRAMVDSTRRRFDDGAGPGGVPWKPSARARAGGKTLVGLGMVGGLMGSVAYEADEGGVRWGSNMRHARIHQFGGTIRPKTASKLAFKVGDRMVFADSVTIPARPYLGFDAEDAAMVEIVVLDALDAMFGGGGDARG